MSKKKQNGFSVFMQEIQQELRRQGRNVPMRDMPTLAGPKWAQLSDARKQAYQAIAKGDSSGAQGYTRTQGPGPGLNSASRPGPGRMDATGVLLSVSNCMNIVWGIRDLIVIISRS